MPAGCQYTAERAERVQNPEKVFSKKHFLTAIAGKGAYQTMSGRWNLT